MKGTVGTKMMGNIENTNPEIISTSRERRQPGSHVSEKKKNSSNITVLFTTFIFECNHAPLSMEFSS